MASPLPSAERLLLLGARVQAHLSHQWRLPGGRWRLALIPLLAGSFLSLAMVCLFHGLTGREEPVIRCAMAAVVLAAAVAVVGEYLSLLRECARQTTREPAFQAALDARLRGVQAQHLAGALGRGMPKAVQRQPRRL